MDPPFLGLGLCTGEWAESGKGVRAQRTDGQGEGAPGMLPPMVSDTDVESIAVVPSPYFSPRVSLSEHALAIPWCFETCN